MSLGKLTRLLALWVASTTDGLKNALEQVDWDEAGEFPGVSYGPADFVGHRDV